MPFGREHAGWICVHTTAGAVLWIADGENYAIRRVGLDGTVTTVAGNGSCGLVDGFGANAQGGLRVIILS